MPVSSCLQTPCGPTSGSQTNAAMMQGSSGVQGVTQTARPVGGEGTHVMSPAHPTAEHGSP